ncbi:MAG TPA: hypothetical protein PLG62_16515 [Pararhodobacter sp.]|uniref:hypothetical protein n=1 Tax=Pararhodobacter sp. TaxID=2127056 RepID=UPI001DCE8895|nr:hypothetical protein [Pararhodobacter sp.]MCB2117905.1 hypothetical protein [Paracoccaceae bacterium]MCB2132352.1 hypothetical protein [Paracoccaceae bacterium]MCB2138095.1 hypothetical protein [Paracoccaceae bacterium]MCB2159939.1 hypothetical protein [Paracoccaceae bacterium]HPD94067.1 hypothetical protein [Pararhodobacter sp.]
MTSIYDCIQRAVDAKELNPARGREAQGQFDQLVARYETIMPRPAAEARAGADLKEATRKAARARYHTVVNQLQAMRRLKAAVEDAPDSALALRNLIEYSEGSGYTGESVRSIHEALNDSINAGLAEVLERVGPNKIGSSRDRILLDQLIDELHGDATGSADAARLAEGVRYQQRRMRQMANAHGADIGELADYGVQHSHSAEEMRRAGFDAWAAEAEQRLGWDKMTDNATGKPFAAAGGQVPPRSVTGRFLKDVYDSVVTRGWNDRDPSMTAGGKALYNRRADHRVLHFKSGADWRAYNAKFGASDPFSAMMNGLHGLARDVAQMRVLGPNPKAGLEFAIQTATKRAAELKSAQLERAVTKQGARARAMFAHVSGAANVPENIAWSRFFSGTRAYLAATQLGSAALSSVSDMATIAVAAKAMGLRPGNVAGRTISLVASNATRQTAARMGFVAQALADAGGGSARYFGHLLGTGIANRLSGFTLRASGLSFITDMRRIAVQMEFAGHLADQAERAFADMDPATRRIFERRGITAADWDLLRDPAVRFVTDDGADFISPIYWLENQTAIPRAEAEGLAIRLQAAIREELELAIPSASIEGRALLQGSAAPGTIPGELLRSSTSYKSFAMSLMLGQYRRFMAQPTPMSKASYAASIAVPLLMTGMLAIQLKELAKGNDPRPMDEGKFWLAAALQSGGLGIFGDFFAAEQSRAGGGIAETIAGPVVGLAGDVIGPVASNITRAINGQETLLGRDVANATRYNAPVASSLWYVRLAYSRIVADQVQAFLDSEAEATWRRQEKQKARDYGTRTWWDRGAFAPARTPDLANALGGG